MATKKRTEDFPPPFMVSAAKEIVAVARKLGVDPKVIGAPLASAMRDIRYDIVRDRDPEPYIMGLINAGDVPEWVLEQARRRSGKEMALETVRRRVAKGTGELAVETALRAARDAVRRGVEREGTAAAWDEWEALQRNRRTSRPKRTSRRRR